jgi:polyisoprenoid-binding protein YceI
MLARDWFRKALAMTAWTIIWTVVANGQSRAIDIRQSSMTVHASKAGVFSALGHDHEISAPIASGTVDAAEGKVELRVNAAALRVLDPTASEKDRAEIQSTMLGPEVLDAQTHAEILFRSSSVEQTGGGHWRVHGNLTLHGNTRPVQVELHESNGHYVGTSELMQTDFGIKPVKAAGGTIRVKDEVRIQFDIQLAR